MIISFFEEFPNKSNLKKLKLINFPTKLYIASHSYKEFLNIKNKIKNKFVKGFIYWPILKKEEGYWISPFSSREALERIFNELKDKNIPVMLDLEIPIFRLFSNIKSNWKDFFTNKKLIKNFIDNYKNIYLCEYYPEGRYKENLLGLFGLHYKNKKIKIIKMVYHSMHKFNEKFMANEMKNGIKKYNENFLISYGAIAKGITGREPILSFKQLDKDLNLAKDNKVNEVIIFRLGGLNKNYLNIIKKNV